MTIFEMCIRDRIYDVAIIGGGPAGYSAALYCARSALSVLVLEKLSAGGQIDVYKRQILVCNSFQELKNQIMIRK